MNSLQNAVVAEAPDLFASEQAALEAARAVYAGEGGDSHRALGQLLVHYERLLRETRRLVQRSDRAERQMNQMNFRLQELASQLEFRASHDPLTGALNRAAVIEHASLGMMEEDMVLIVLDIDHFKQVNDSFGHPAGDAVIRTVVQCLRELLGEDAAVGRVGGEEFSVVWPGLTLAEGRELGERIRAAIEAQSWPEPIDRPVTASVGVSWNERGSSFEQAYSRADQALYRAKRGGRNCVCVAD